MSKYTIEFGPKSAARLEKLAASQETSRAEVVRRALEFYDRIMSEARNGAHLVIDREGKEREVLI